MNKLPARFVRFGKAIENKKKMDQLKKKPLTGKDVAERKHCIDKLNQFAKERGLKEIEYKL